MTSKSRAAKARADALAKTKDRLAKAAENELIGTIAAFWPPGTELTDDAIEAICDAVEAYATDAYAYAAHYYESSVGDSSDVRLSDLYSRQWTAQAIKTASYQYAGKRKEIARQITSHATRMISRVAGNYVIESVRKSQGSRGGSRNSGKRFARVPSGGETCMFCLMLASRGWVYWSRETAGEFDHYHSDCRCTVAASDEYTPALDGYDPDALYDRYKACRRTVSFEFAKYGDSTNAILREMARRDVRWIRDGIEPEIEYEDGAEPLEKEKPVAELLKRNGFPIVWKARSNTAKSPEFSIKGRIWDVKRPEGHEGKLGKQTIYHQFEEAMAQGAQPIIDVSLLEEEGICSIDDVIDTAEHYVNWHFKTPRGKKQAREALIVNHEEIYRVRARNE